MADEETPEAAEEETPEEVTEVEPEQDAPEPEAAEVESEQDTPVITKVYGSATMTGMRPKGFAEHQAAKQAELARQRKG